MLTLAQLRKVVWERDKGICRYCKKKVHAEDYQMDHVIPRSQGGSNELKNLACACGICNSQKHNRRPEELLGEVFKGAPMGSQLSLGEYEISDFEEHTIHVPLPLILEIGMPGEAMAVYMVMKSFGKRAEASLEAYAERLGWSIPTTRKWQNFLVGAAWIVLLREGKNTNPRLWWICKSKGEQPPLNYLILRTLAKNEDVENSDTKQSLSREVKVSSKEPAAKAAPFQAADGTAWQVLVDDYYAAFKEAKGEPLLAPEMTGADFAQLKRLASNKQFTLALYRARLANMKWHSFHRTVEFSLAIFCTKFREFDDNSEGIKKAKAGNPQQRKAYFPVQKVDDFNG